MIDNLTFPIMQLVATPGVLELPGFIDLAEYLNRHISGDYGEVNKDSFDTASNHQAILAHKGMVLSVYNLPDGGQLNIKTDFSVGITTIYLPEED